jgi:hypothetical protein
MGRVPVPPCRRRGVAEGASWLYETFPETFHHILIDPLALHEPHLQRFVRECGGRYFLTAVGAENGTAVMDAVLVRPGKSSWSVRPSPPRRALSKNARFPETSTLGRACRNCSWISSSSSAGSL